MGVFDGLAELLAPHAQRLNGTIAASSAHVGTKLDDISESLNRATALSKWFRIQIAKELPAEKQEIGQVPMNEVWILQSLVVDGIQNKSPAFVIEADNALIASVIKEGVGSEKFNVAFLPGEEITITPREKGFIRAGINIIRQPIPAQNKPSQSTNTPSSDRVTPVNTHNPARDIIESQTGIYQDEIPHPEGSGRYDPASTDPVGV